MCILFIVNLDPCTSDLFPAFWFVSKSLATSWQPLPYLDVGAAWQDDDRDRPLS